jgi:hypothetical protein
MANFPKSSMSSYDHNVLVSDLNIWSCSVQELHIQIWYMRVHLVPIVSYQFVVIGPPSSSRRESHTEVTLKLWKEGFSINNGAVREYADPANREFLESVRRG